MRNYGSCNITIGSGADGERVEGKFNNTSTGRGAMAAAFIHNEREKEVINADPERTRFNHDIIDIEDFKDEYYRAQKNADYRETKAAIKYMETVNKRRFERRLEPVIVSEQDFIRYRELYRESEKQSLSEDRAVFNEYRDIYSKRDWMYKDKDLLLKGLIVDAESKKEHVKSPYELISDKRTSEMSYYSTPKANGVNHPVRKDAVVMIQLVLTLTRPMGSNGIPQEMSTDYDMKARERFEQISLEWARERFKDPVTGKDNIVAATAHYDETSPHIHLMVCPEVDGRYNQHPFIGGSAKWRMLSVEYGNLMAKEFGINKPLENAMAKKTRHQAFRADKIARYNSMDTPAFDGDLIDQEGKVQFKYVQEYIDKRDELDKDIIALHANELTSYKNTIKTLKTQIRHPEQVTKNKIQTLESRVEYLERTLDDTNYILSDETRSKTEALELIAKMQNDPDIINMDTINALQNLLNTDEYKDIIMMEKERALIARTEEEKKRQEEAKQRRKERRKKLYNTLSK